MDHIEEPAEETPEKPHVIIVIGGHDPIASSMSRRLMMLAAMQVVVLVGREMVQEDAPPSLEDLSRLILERHIPDMPPILTALVPRDISHDYNAHAAYAPRKVDVGMAAKAHSAAERMAAKAARFRHFHY